MPRVHDIRAENPAELDTAADRDEHVKTTKMSKLYDVDIERPIDDVLDISDNDPVNTSPGPKANTCNLSRWLMRLIFFLFLLVGIAAGLALIFRGTANPAELFARGRLPGVNDTQKWDSPGFQGLSLLIENALEDKWIPYFEEYVAQWDQGSPDALTLATTRVSVDSSCQPSTGSLKICNGDYGNTDWNGINFNLVQNGYIISSTSKMNDYHLDGMTADDKKYTMCHEMGHGFGLAHTDENYGNANLGNCLDYTYNVQGNLSPGTFNYELLAKVYGTVPPSRRLIGGMVPQHVMDSYHAMTKTIEHSQSLDCATGYCVKDLGNDYRLEARKLLVAKV